MSELRVPQRVYDFTQFSQTRPREQQPGDRLDAQFGNHAESIRQIISHLNQQPAQRLVTLADLEPLQRSIDEIAKSYELSQNLAHQVAEEAARQAESASQRAADAERNALAAQREIAQVALARQDDLQALEARLAEANQLLVELRDMAAPSPPLEGENVLGPNAGGPYAGDVQGATATSADYAQVSIDWAEFMPTTIPPNILAINAITGDHWSSRWWATKAQNAFGMLTDLYLGVWPTPPTTNNTGGPITIDNIWKTRINTGLVMLQMSSRLLKKGLCVVSCIVICN